MELLYSYLSTLRRCGTACEHLPNLFICRGCRYSPSLVAVKQGLSLPLQKYECWRLSLCIQVRTSAVQPPPSVSLPST